MTEKEVAPLRERGRADLHIKPEEALKPQPRLLVYNYSVVANGKAYILSCKDSLGRDDRERQSKLAMMLNSPAKSKDLSIASGQTMDQFKDDFFKGRRTVTPDDESSYLAYAQIDPIEVKTVPKNK